MILTGQSHFVVLRLTHAGRGEALFLPSWELSDDVCDTVDVACLPANRVASVSKVVESPRAADIPNVERIRTYSARGHEISHRRVDWSPLDGDDGIDVGSNL